jgi:hypothetical protein
VTDTYPPNEVGDIPGPAYCFIQTPGTNPGANGVRDTRYTPKKSDKRYRKGDPPLFVCPAFNRRGNINGNIMVIFVTYN